MAEFDPSEQVTHRLLWRVEQADDDPSIWELVQVSDEEMGVESLDHLPLVFLTESFFPLSPYSLRHFL